jgi:dTDP-4-dehydrorhamnose reductase
MTRRWLVVGAAGMLGQDLVPVLRADGDDVVGLDRAEMDITSQASVSQVLQEVRPDIVVNCAAYTQVDLAESDEEAALLVNGEGPRLLASEIASLPGTRLVQVSTDYVFPGDAVSPYDEESPTGPHSVYGRSKLAGERAVLDLLPERSAVVRTAWLYGAHGPNFVETMLRLEQERPTVDVVDDQRGQPTWTQDLGHRIRALGPLGAAHGVFHATASGATTWYGFAREIFEASGADPDRVRPTTSDQFVRPAPRPSYSVLGHRRWASVGMEPLRSWTTALHEYLESRHGR